MNISYTLTFLTKFDLRNPNQRRFYNQFETSSGVKNSEKKNEQAVFETLPVFQFLLSTVY